MQSKDELEDWYKTSDPWGYETNPDDLFRKHKIMMALRPHMYKRAIDIGCGEGWITKDLPAKIIYGLELSDAARARIPHPVIPITEPSGKYDLIVITGVLYTQYDHQSILDLVKKHRAKSGTILTCHIKSWEQPLPYEDEYVEEFPYREYTQILRRYTWEK